MSEPCAVSPDGSFVLSLGHDTARVWAVPATGKRWRRKSRAILPWPRGYGSLNAWACGVSGDVAFVALARADSSVAIWTATEPSRRRWELKRVLAGHSDVVVDCAVSPDGSMLATASSDGTAKLWDPMTGEELSTLVGHTGGVDRCAFGPDASLLVTGGEKEIKVWGVTLALRAAAPPRATIPIRALSVGSRRRMVASAGWETIERVWDLETGTTRRHSSPAGGVASPSGSFLVSAESYRSLEVRDLADGRVRTLSHEAEACAVSSDGSLVASAGTGASKLWDARTWTERFTLPHRHTVAPACSFSPDGSFVVCVSGDDTLRIWDTETGEARQTLTCDEGAIAPFAISPDGSFVVSASRDNRVRIWDTASGRERKTLEGHHRVLQCAISPDGSFVVSGGREGMLRTSDVATGRERYLVAAHSGDVNGCAVSPDASVVLSVGNEGYLRIWSAEAGEELGAFPTPGRAGALAVHPAKPLVACEDAGGNAYLLELVGFGFGPLVVTAVETGGRTKVVCPACRRPTDVPSDELGTVVSCPHPTCGVRLRINREVARPPRFRAKREAVAGPPRAGPAPQGWEWGE
jgi:WD40 repeat protein